MVHWWVLVHCGHHKTHLLGQLILLYCMFWACNGHYADISQWGLQNKPLLLKRAIVEGLAQVLVVKQNPNKGVLD
jgi:hypothetical protein